ncbi:MAG: glyoxalase [Bacteroidetes bacterium MedPE-SWsnd-G2]|nr:MAG: glyoxalase [Bacteroidetes bacterium MedPE-SWsnd-G2]
MAQTNLHIDYIEFKAKDLNQIKLFYQSVFDWSFTDYGPSYCSFENSGLSGGFELTNQPIVNGTLVVIYHSNLDLLIPKIVASDGHISKPIFSFPGGRRFHFTDPSGNELAVWSEK